jgi:methylenetetrahydrofolate reductase (NADPH)
MIPAPEIVTGILPRKARKMSDNIAPEIAELVACGSLEMGAHRPADAARIAELLPSGTPVYVNHLPRHALSDTLRALFAVREAGLEPVPHIAARRVTSAAEIEGFLMRAVRAAGVSKVLLIGGDTPSPEGPFPDTASLLSTGVLTATGVREVGFAGFPEGHPRVATATINAALLDKLSIAQSQGLGTRVISQFSFSPARVIEYSTWLQHKAPNVPLYVGVPGPTSPASLLKFAQACGVSASFRALTAQGFGAVRLATHTDPTEQLTQIARHCMLAPQTNIVGAHLYAFGAIEKTAAWMHRCITSRAVV